MYFMQKCCPKFCNSELAPNWNSEWNREFGVIILQNSALERLSSVNTKFLSFYSFCRNSFHGVEERSRSSANDILSGAFTEQAALYFKSFAGHLARYAIVRCSFLFEQDEFLLNLKEKLKSFFKLCELALSSFTRPFWKLVNFERPKKYFYVFYKYM